MRGGTEHVPSILPTVAQAPNDSAPPERRDGLPARGVGSVVPSQGQSNEGAGASSVVFRRALMQSRSASLCLHGTPRHPTDAALRSALHVAYPITPALSSHADEVRRSPPERVLRRTIARVRRPNRAAIDA